MLWDERATVLGGMPQAGQITLKDVAWCAGVKAPRLRSWAKGDRLRSVPPFNEKDAIEAAIAFSLAKGGISQKAATAAWDGVRSDIRKLLLRTSDIWVVVDADGPDVAAVEGAAAAGRAAATMGLCWVVPVELSIEQARKRYAKVSAGLPTRPGGLARLSGRRSVRDRR